MAWASHASRFVPGRPSPSASDVARDGRAARSMLGAVRTVADDDQRPVELGALDDVDQMRGALVGRQLAEVERVRRGERRGGRGRRRADRAMSTGLGMTSMRVAAQLRRARPQVAGDRRLTAMIASARGEARPLARRGSRACRGSSAAPAATARPPRGRMQRVIIAAEHPGQSVAVVACGSDPTSSTPASSRGPCTRTGMPLACAASMDGSVRQDVLRVDDRRIVRAAMQRRQIRLRATRTAARS